MSEIKTETKEIFRTTGGRTFDDKLSAVACQADLDSREDILKYITAMHPDAKDRHVKSLQRILKDWEIYKALRAEGVNVAPPSGKAEDEELKK